LELCNREGADSAMLDLANSTFDAYFRDGIGPQTRVGTLSRLPIAAAQLGRGEAIRYLLPAQLRASDAGRGANAPGIMRNRMALREGPGATECERLGRVAEALHAALLQSAPPAPGGEPIVHVLPACPKEWDVDFTLLARGNFLVGASTEKGEVRAVEIESRSGGALRLRWPTGHPARGEVVAVLPVGSDWPAARDVR